MKDDAPADSRTTQERFSALGKQVLTVPRSEIEKRDKKWQARKKKQTKRS